MKRLTRNELETMQLELDAIDFINLKTLSNIATEIISGVYNILDCDYADLLERFFRLYDTYSRYEQAYNDEDAFIYRDVELKLYYINEYNYKFYKTIFSLLKNL